jgi:RNA polymerase sigma-70 factor (ECF subfamily)
MAENLIQRWLDHGDERAAEALYQAHYRRIYRLAYALLGNAQDAEEVMQGTMIHALTHTKSYDPERLSFTSWLHTIAISRCRDRQRAQGDVQASSDGRSKVGNQSVREVSDRVGGAAPRLNRDVSDGFWQAFDQLNPQLREAVVLRYWSGHTYQEMAQILRCPVTTAQSRVRWAYEQLRGLLGPTAGGALMGGNVR